MNTLEATYRIVTPMFIGDADQKATSLRSPSIKGMLRFWWRALNWGHCLEMANSEPNLALRHLHEREKHLFGLAAAIQNDKQIGGQGCFLLTTTQPQIRHENQWPINNTGSGYLGYGLFATNQQPHREALKEAGEFTLRFIFKPGSGENDIASIREALEAWGLFGGLGSRARRGFGSVTLVKLNNQDKRLDLSGYQREVQTFLTAAEVINDYPPYTAFSAQADFHILASGPEARRVHNKAGLLYNNHRGQPSTLRGRAKLPFGLPLQNVDERNRRASPLLFHIHELKDGSFVAAVLYLPAEFHFHYPQMNLGNFYRDVRSFP